MNPSLLGLAGLGIGCVVGIAVDRWRRPAPSDRPAPQPEPPDSLLPPGVSEVVARLPSAAAVVGADDEVLQSTTPARTLGIVRGSRVAVDDILELVRAARRDAMVLTDELELARGPATLFLSVRVAPLHDDLVLLLCEDTTAARRVENTRRDFVANVSHELKTPIGAIALLAEAVESAAGDPEAVRKFSARMLTESERLTVLVSQVIALSKLQADQPLTQAEPVHVDEVVAGAVDRCRVDADRHGVSLTVTGETGCLVLGDAAELETAVGNLVENAVSYSDSGASVLVATRTVPAGVGDPCPAGQPLVEISVADNGIGIAADDLDRIFERFYRVDYARSRANGGTGLGLSIVKHVATIHGGTVQVRSEPGRGSTFGIRLPALSITDRPPAEPRIAPDPDLTDRATEGQDRPTQGVS